jgi:uncharacterized protein YqeY
MSKTRIQEDLKAAMKAGDHATRDALRMLLAAVTTAEKAQGSALDDAAVLQVAAKVAKQTRGSIEEYQRLGQTDSVAKLQGELAIYERYAPEQLSEEKIRAIVAEAVATTAASSAADMGKVMKLVMPRVSGKADGGLVNRIVKEALNP